MLFGVFAASGFYHEWTVYTMGKGLDSSITLFFVWQAVAVSAERVWYKVTGKKVKGGLGCFGCTFGL